jgi:hypothetical protein
MRSIGCCQFSPIVLSDDGQAVIKDRKNHMIKLKTPAEAGVFSSLANAQSGRFPDSIALEPREHGIGIGNLERIERAVVFIAGLDKHLFDFTVIDKH